MARCTHFFLCRSVSQDPFSNVLTVVDMVQALNVDAASIPSASDESPSSLSPFGFVIVALLQRDDPAVTEDLSSRITIVTPKGREFSGAEARVDLTAGGYTRNLTLMPDFAYTGDGTYRFLMQIQKADSWVTVAEFSMPLKIIVKGAGAPS
jgi:hypothetical protein